MGATREPWCVLAQIVRGRLHTSKIPESLVDIATGRGWVIVARDSEMPIGPHDIDPAQSNPRRVDDGGD